MLDWVIEGGDVIDGTGSPAARVDIGIRGDRVEVLGDLGAAAARHRLDARGRTVTPGFIDVHSHSDLTVLANPGFESTIRQGVTTEVVGNCGLAMAPLNADGRAAAQRQLRGYGYEGDVSWRTFPEYMDRVAAEGTSANLLWLVGHGALRAAAGIHGPRADSVGMRTMRRQLEEALDAGAAGISSGLEYDPGRDVAGDELLRMVRVVGERGGYYTSHIRNRDARLLEAVDEFIGVVRASGVHGQISHLNVRDNTGAVDGAWELAVARMEAARADGFDVFADALPFTFGLGLMVNVLPSWLVSDGFEAAAKGLSDPAVRDRVRDDVDRYWRFLSRGDWGRARLLNSREHPELNGRTFAEIATVLDRRPWDAYFDVLAAAGRDMDGLFMVGDLVHEEQIVDQVRHPLYLLGADTMSARLDGPMGALFGSNPISFAGQLHYLLRYGIQLRALPLERLVWKLTGMAAERFGLANRGVIRPRAAADLVVLDLGALVEHVSPPGYPEGVEHVFVNGEQVIAAGRHTGLRPGRNLGRS